jgi:hypothetical protein
MTWDIQFHYMAMEPLNHDDDETLSNIIKRKHPRKGKKKYQIARTKAEAGKRAPKRCTTRR